MNVFVSRCWNVAFLSHFLSFPCIQPLHSSWLVWMFVQVECGKFYSSTIIIVSFFLSSILIWTRYGCQSSHYVGYNAISPVYLSVGIVIYFVLHQFLFFQFFVSFFSVFSFFCLLFFSVFLFFFLFFLFSCFFCIFCFSFFHNFLFFFLFVFQVLFFSFLSFSVFFCFSVFSVYFCCFFLFFFSFFSVTCRHRQTEEAIKIHKKKKYGKMKDRKGVWRRQN